MREEAQNDTQIYNPKLNALPTKLPLLPAAARRSVLCEQSVNPPGHVE